MFSGYIFDVEGTLVDTVPQSLRSLQEALEQAGFAIPYATLPDAVLARPLVGELPRSNGQTTAWPSAPSRA
jgi:phosphoglycolate phosphatase-like HAD superfamily hydrolase